MRVISIDFETSGLDYHSPDFEVTDLAISWFDDLGNMVSKHVKGQTEVGKSLGVLSKKKLKVVVHNLTFELGVLQAQFPEVSLDNWEMFDTQRLCQVGDAGTTQKMYKTRYREQGGETKDGLNLVACCSRWLYGRFHDHKKVFYDYLVKHKSVKQGTEGANLQLLPAEMLKDYNCADTENTLRLYEEVTKQFEVDRYIGWVTDHVLYRGRCQELVNAKILGVKVDPEANKKCIEDTTEQLDNIWKDFHEVHKNDIQKCIAIKIKAYCDDPTLKKDSAREARWYKVAVGIPFGDRQKICGFNVNGGDLLMLYRDVLGITPPFYTLPNKKTGSEGGNPSFKKAHLSAWHGVSGKILENKGTLRIVKSQANSLQILASKDGRYHLDMLATGTKTGRLSGSANDGS